MNLRLYFFTHLLINHHPYIKIKRARTKFIIYLQFFIESVIYRELVYHIKIPFGGISLAHVRIYLQASEKGFSWKVTHPRRPQKLGPSQ